MELYQVTTDKFVCGILVKDGVIKYAAPILMWARNKDLVQLRKWVKEHKGTIERVDGVDYA